MTTPKVDQRSPGRRARDEQIAAEPQLAPREILPDAAASPVEAHLGRLRLNGLADARDHRARVDILPFLVQHSADRDLPLADARHQTQSTL